jgi:hypothetical protein
MSNRGESVKPILYNVHVFHCLKQIQVVVANAGDAKAVLGRSVSTDGEGVVDDTKSQLKAIVLTREHKAIFPQERSRIQKVICFMYSVFLLFFYFSLIT